MTSSNRNRGLLAAGAALVTAVMLLPGISSPARGATPPAAGSSPVTYIHDALGRLEAVVDPAIGTAVYHYDAVGNITSIQRVAIGGLDVVDFTPRSAPPGATVTVEGRGFSTTPGNDSVTINGTAATVTAATSTALSVTVPSSATAGFISVTVGAKNSTSAGRFNPSSVAPTITSISPSIVTAGSTVTVNGTNFQTSSEFDRVTFATTVSTVSSPTGTSLTTVVPGSTQSGHLFVSTPDGVAATDYFVPPSGYLTSQVTYTTRTTVGSVLAANVPGSQQVGLVVFDGSAGQQVTLSLIGANAESMALYSPSGSLLRTSPSLPNSLIDGITLTSSGTYTVLLPGVGSGESANLGVYPASADIAANLPPGSAAQPLVAASPGQVFRVSVPIQANQRASFLVTSGTFANPCDEQLTLLDPNSNVVFGPSCAGQNAYFDAATYASAGTYTLLFVPASTDVGSVTITDFAVPTDAHSSLTVGGSAGTLNITTPGQNGQATFTGTASQSVTVSATSPWTTGTSQLGLLAPNGVLIGQATVNHGSTATTIGPVTLPAAGSYLIVLDPSGSLTGSVSVSVAQTAAGIAAPSLGRWPPGRVVRVGAPHSGLSTTSATLPLLTAAPTATAVTGRALDASTGTGIPGVVYSSQGRTATSAADGRFLLSGLAAGMTTVRIDATSTPKGNYGVYDEILKVAAGKSTPLPSTTWLTKLDTADRITVPSPAPSNLVLTAKAVPGLEILVPKGTVLRSPAGQVVTTLTVTPMAYDRTPIELPAGMPSFFTVQPADTTVTGSAGIRIVYPNVAHFVPGEKVPYWAYGPQGKSGWNGWWEYGHGTVSADGTQVMPTAGTTVSLITPFGQTQQPPPNGGPKGPQGGDPVDLYTGLLSVAKTDLSVRDVIPATFTHYLRQNDPVSRALGIGGDDNYDIYLTDAGSNINLTMGNGAQYVFTPTGNNTWAEGNDPGAFMGATLTRNGETWTIVTANGTTYGFADKLTELVFIRDRNGNTLTIDRPNLYDIGTIVTPFGRTLTLTADSTHRITSVTDQAGRAVTFTYDSSGRLATVTDVTGGVTTYSYAIASCGTPPVAGCGNITSITDPAGTAYITNTYDANNRVISQVAASHGTYTFAYQTNTSSQVIATTETDPRGITSTTTFNGAGYPTGQEQAVGTSQEATTTYLLDPVTNETTDVVDPSGRDTHFTYDAFGDLLSETQMFGTSEAQTSTWAYDPVYHEVVSSTDPAGDTTTTTIDSTGDPVTITDAAGGSQAMTYNQYGLLTASTDPSGDTTSFGYLGGDVASVTDAAGNTSTIFTDLLGRQAGRMDPFGNTTVYQFNQAGEISQATDALGNLTTYAYDKDGDLTSATNGNNATSTFTYNSGLELTGQSDALGRTTQYAYDGDGNLTSETLPTGTVNVFGFDNLNQENFAGYGAVTVSGHTNYASTVSYAHDADSRMTGATDSAFGTVSNTYDDFNNLATQASPSGAVSFTYDTDNRLISQTLSGQSATNYTYDPVGRLTSATTGSQSGTWSYDAAGRVIAQTSPNGVSVSNSYSADSQPTTVSYTGSAGSLGSLTYTYDAAGHQSSLAGSLAADQLPAAVPARTYDAANEMVTNGGTSLSYDPNGDLTKDGSLKLAWNQRGQVSSATVGTTTYSYAYDAFGRRVATTVAGATTGAVYGLPNKVVDTTAGSPSATLLSGKATNDWVARTDSSGTNAYATAPNGSVIGLVNPSGALATTYTYDPFGATSPSGAASANAQQWIGASADPTGLYYDNARYYLPALERFASPDPLTAGQYQTNAYTYAGNDPVDAVDTSGLQQGNTYKDAFDDYTGGHYQNGQTLGQADNSGNNTLRTIATVASGPPSQAGVTVSVSGGPGGFLTGGGSVSVLYGPNGVQITATGSTGLSTSPQPNAGASLTGTAVYNAPNGADLTGQGNTVTAQTGVVTGSVSVSSNQAGQPTVSLNGGVATPGFGGSVTTDNTTLLYGTGSGTSTGGPPTGPGPGYITN